MRPTGHPAGRVGPLTRLGAAIGVVAVLLIAVAPAASAHPLGNATVNHYDGLDLYPDRITDRAIEDIAEIPTVQRHNLIDTDGNGTLSDQERADYASAQCTSLARADNLTVNGRRLALQVQTADYTERPGAIGLKTGRLLCQLEAKAELTRPSTVVVSEHWDSDGIGWHEITAVGTGVSLRHSPFPQTSVSGELATYPNDLLTSPLNVRDGSVDTVPGAGTSTYAAARNLPVAGAAVRALNRLTTTFDNLVGAKQITVGVGLLAVLLSMLLGAGHAFLPGHGKTIMAAYLVGRRGRLRDVVTVGATVTITHTAGVLILGLLISLTTAVAPTAAEQVLGVVSGLIVAAVGAGLLITALRRQRPSPATDSLTALAHLDQAQHANRAHNHDHAHPHPAVAGAAAGRSLLLAPDSQQPHPASPSPGSPAHDHDHDGHDRQPGERQHLQTTHTHGGVSHTHVPGRRPFGRGGLVGLGVAGGLVPSPSALLVLLAAIALGRTIFGIVVVLAYGLGMATALSVAGLLLVRLRHHASRLASSRLSRLTVLSEAVPFATATLVLAVGCWLALRAAGGTI